MCSTSLRRKHPWNILALIAFTVVESVLVGCICSYWDVAVVLEAFAVTCAAVAGLTLVAIFGERPGGCGDGGPGSRGCMGWPWFEACFAGAPAGPAAWTPVATGGAAQYVALLYCRSHMPDMLFARRLAL